jgi:hypothetical protein
VNEYIALVDVASKNDRYAEIVMRDILTIHQGQSEVGTPDHQVHRYQIVWAKQGERMRYEEMENSTLALMGRAELKNNCDLLVDGTGVGDPYVEHLRTRGCYPISIIFTSGGSAHDVYDDAGHVFGKWADELSVKTLKEIRVPKRDLTLSGALMLQQNRLIIGKRVAHREALIAQLNGFRGDLLKKKSTFEAQFEELHDDLVVCFLMGSWWAIKRRPMLPERELSLSGVGRTSWEPSAYDALDFPAPPDSGPPHMGARGF